MGNAEVRAALNAHLDSFEQTLADAGIPRSERHNICDQLEARACEMAWMRAEGEPTEQHMKAVLAELKDSESYGKAVEPGWYSLRAIPILHALLSIGASIFAEAFVLSTRNGQRRIVEDFELDVFPVIHFAFGPIFPVLLAIVILAAIVKAVVPRFRRAANAWNVLALAVITCFLGFYLLAMFSLVVEVMALRGPH